MQKAVKKNGTLGCFNIPAMERIDQSSYVEALWGERLEVYFGVSAQRRGTLRVALEAIYEPDSFLDEAGT